MSLVVEPDPGEPAGGYAFLKLPAGSLPDAQAGVAVFDAFGERWLAPTEEPGARPEIGQANWQSDRIEFGPYDVYRHEGADRVRIGPEIVNKLEEYAPVRLEIAGQPYDVVWPDTVPPRAGAAVLGRLQTVARKQPDPGGERLVGKAVPALTEPPPPEPAPSTPDLPAPEPQQHARMGSFLIPLLGLLLLIAGVAGWYFWPQQTGSETEAVPPPSLPDPCTPARLGDIAGGFERTAQAIRDCGPRVSADTALRLVENAAASHDGAALLLFGTLYDGSVTDAPIETLIGLSFEDDPAKAVEYYDRALRAGSAPAAERKAATCARLATSDATLAKGAHDDFCVE